MHRQRSKPPSIPTTTPLLASLTLLLALPHTTWAQAQPTAGPLAAVSMAKQPAYSTARACASPCLVYQGSFACGVNAGYDDLGWRLGCGCSPINDCYCSAGYASSATSYLSGCVSSRCAKLLGDGWTAEAGSLLGVYDGYCATANVPTSTGGGPAATTTKQTTAATGKAATAVTGDGAQSAATSSSTPQASAAAAESGKGGLSQSDIVALAASLGVGVPSLLIAGLTLWVQLRRKKNRAGADAAGVSDKDDSPHVSSS